jgi:hypothetical protein
MITANRYSSQVSFHGNIAAHSCADIASRAFLESLLKRFTIFIEQLSQDHNHRSGQAYIGGGATQALGASQNSQASSPLFRSQTPFHCKSTHRDSIACLLRMINEATRRILYAVAQ